MRRAHWYGVGAPKNTPAEIVEKLNKEINAALADPKMKARLADLGGTALPGSPADFGKLIADETEKWAKVVKFSDAKGGLIGALAIFHKSRSARRTARRPLRVKSRTSSLGAVRPLPLSADIGPRGQSVRQAAQFCLDRPVKPAPPGCQPRCRAGRRDRQGARRDKWRRASCQRGVSWCAVTAPPHRAECPDRGRLHRADGRDAG